MSRLLSELQNYRGDGIAAKLFYESKVTEALSLVVEYQKKRPAAPSKLSQSDLERIQTVAAYLSDHYAAAWGEEYLAGTTSVENIIWRLRKKLEGDSKHLAYIKTVVGAGYKIEIACRKSG